MLVGRSRKASGEVRFEGELEGAKETPSRDLEEGHSRHGTASAKALRGEMPGGHKEPQRGQCGWQERAEGQVTGMRSQRREGMGSLESPERGALAGLLTEEETICFRL